MKALATLRAAGDEVLALARAVAGGDAPDADALGESVLLAPLRGAPHDPVHHAEGDPLTHTALVVEALVALPGFRALGPRSRLSLALAALLHDVAKPETAVVDGGRVSHPNHAPRGARRARAALYAAGLEASVREAAASLCARHMQPHHALASRPDDVALLRWAAGASLEVPLELLLQLCEADTLGRRTMTADGPAAPTSAEGALLLREFAREHDLLERPFPFPDASTRLACCRDRARDPRYTVNEPERGPLVTVLSGLPGSGKSTRARELEAAGAARASVEDLMDAGLDRGTAVQRAKETLRQALRDGRDAVWDATMLTRQIRRSVVSLAEDYGARTRILAIEVDAGERRARTLARGGDLPDRALADMLHAWSVPTHDEALLVEGRPARLRPDE